jgi:hypothetical protein
MKRLLVALFLSAFALNIFSQQMSMQFSDKNIRDIRKEFQSPPAEYGLILWWGWDGPVTDTVIKRDLDRIKAMGFSGVMIEAGYGMTAKYLSPEWFRLVKTGVAEAKKRGMKVWIEDEGKYPSGFAGGKFSTERPDLKMQGLVVLERIDIKEGETVERKTLPGTLSAVAYNTSGNSLKMPDISSGHISWPSTPGNWKIITAGSRFRSSVTRSVNNPSRGKDTTASLMDYLNPAATRQFLQWTHEQYKKYIGEEFGKTFQGFMGDEPDFAYTPWTPGIVEEFRKRKGYDITPYFAAFFATQPSEEIRKAKADYWDVWSDLFRDNFFTVQADWCRENNIEYIVHLNHEDQLPGLVKSSGDFFKNMRNVGIPGVDAIWSQIWMDHVSDYPKLASSAAHLFGKPRAFTESFAAYSYRPTVPQAKWVLDYQLVRGINSVQIMFMSASAYRPRQTQENQNRPAVVQRSSFFMSDTFPGVAAYVNRASYLLSQGRPACNTGVYVPTTSMWMSDNDSYSSLLSISRELLENQIDFDFVDEQALCSVMKYEKGIFTNLSGQKYNTILVPRVSVMSKTAMERLRIFSSGGGKVIFIGGPPEMISDKSILSAEKCGGVSWASIEASGTITPALLGKLPQPELILLEQCRQVKYLHRKLNGADLYFLFNEGKEAHQLRFTVSASGKTEEWNAMTGKVTRIKPVLNGGTSMTLSADFQPWETKFYIVYN